MSHSFYAVARNDADGTPTALGTLDPRCVTVGIRQHRTVFTVDHIDDCDCGMPPVVDCAAWPEWSAFADTPSPASAPEAATLELRPADTRFETCPGCHATAVYSGDPALPMTVFSPPVGHTILTRDRHRCPVNGAEYTRQRGQ